MKLEAGKTYKCQNGATVTLENSSQPYYKFKAAEIDFGDGYLEPCHEMWAEEGVAFCYDRDRGYNIVSEVKG